MPNEKLNKLGSHVGRGIARGLGALLLGAVGGYAVAVFSGVVDLPDIADPKAIACYIKDEAFRLTGKALPPPEKGVRILVARLETDDDGRQTRHVADSLRHMEGFEVQELCRTLALGQDQDVSIAMRKAKAKGRNWLRTRNAAILVWGQVEQVDKSVRLRLLSRDSESADKFLTLQEDLTLPSDFAPNLSVVLAASVLSQALALTQVAGDGASSGQYVVAELLPLLESLRTLVGTIETLPPIQASEARLAYLSALVTLSGQTGDQIYAEEARAYVDRVLPSFTPAQWRDHASTVFWRGRALYQLGARRGEPAIVEAAIVDYRKATDLWWRRAPLEWARTQIYIGSALRRLGEWRDDERLIEHSIAANRLALKEFSRKTNPLDWARAQSGLGGGYRLLGERRKDAALIEEAIKAFQNALAERKRKQVPLNWAATQSSLAAALAKLGDLRGDVQLVEQAIAAYREALEERTRERVPLSWGTTQDNLGDALFLAGRISGDDKKTVEAVKAYRSALEVRTREATPVAHADTQRHLGVALAARAERHQDRALYAEAAGALATALAIYEGKAIAASVAATRRDLDAVETKRAALGPAPQS